MLNDSLELPNLFISPEYKSLKGSPKKSPSRCRNCSNLSCTCGEKLKPRKARLRSQITPNNFKQYLPSVEKTKHQGALGCVLTPSISGLNKSYISYVKSKKSFGDSSQFLLNGTCANLMKPKFQTNNNLFRSSFKKKFDKENYLKEKILKIALKYLEDPESRYERKRLVEMLYNLIQQGEKGNYACTIKRKIEEIARFLVKHNQDLNFESFLLKTSEKEEKLISRFDEFLKAFSSSIIR